MARVLVIGRTGQVATALAAVCTPFELVFRGRPEADLTDPASLARALEEVAPDLVINAAAYTAVDRAESEPELARAVNADGAGALARLCARAGAPLIHLSTDYVFAGDATGPYPPDAPVAPQGAYGRSKAAGEAEVRAGQSRHLIVRTAWVYAARGNNFLNTMLRLAGERDRLTIVDDQSGAPTYAADIAVALCRIAEKVLADPEVAPWGTYHLTNAGETTWFGFAREIFAIAAAHGRTVPQIVPVTTAEFPTPARRPAYSVLDTTATTRAFGVAMPDWRDALRRCLEARLTATAAAP